MIAWGTPRARAVLATTILAVGGAEQALNASATIADRAPRFAGRALAVAETVASGPLEIAITGTSYFLISGRIISRRSSSPVTEFTNGRP